MDELTRCMERLEKKNPAAVTVWSTTQGGFRFQANIQLRKGGGWHVKFGNTVEEALIEAINGVMRGEREENGDGLPQTIARDRIRAAANEDEQDRPRERVRVERKRVEPPAKRVMDDGPDLFRGGGRTRIRV